MIEGKGMTEYQKPSLLDKERWYGRLLKAMNEGFSVRDENSYFIYVNDKFCEMLGYERDEFVGRKIDEFIDPSCLNILENQLAKRKKGQKSTYELTWLKKNGDKLYTIMSAAPLQDDCGNFRGGFGVMTDITIRKTTEEKLLVYQSKLKTLSSELSLAEERERRRISSELHDRIGQTLAITRIRLGKLIESVSSDIFKKELEEIRNLVKQTIHHTRSLTVEISPPILYELGFVAAVEWYVEQIQQQSAYKIQFEDDNLPKPLDEDVMVFLFKAIQELLFNIEKHAYANKVKVTLKVEEDRILILVEDDGVGLGFKERRSQPQKSKKMTFGLFNIRERLDHIGGSFEISSSPKQGTRAKIFAPLKDKGGI
jgi:PAS domain S-box-containing protein